MRAMQMLRYGGPDQLQLVELAQPLPQAGKVLVRVRCASVNPVDWKRASGALRLIMPVRFPAVPGYDVAGDVVSVGAGVSGFSVGMRVHARIADMNAGGCADYAIVGAVRSRLWLYEPAYMEVPLTADGSARTHNRRGKR